MRTKLLPKGKGNRPRLYAVLLAAVFLLMLCTRIIFLPYPGLEYDMNFNQQWQRQTVLDGVASFYREGDNDTDYLPVPLILWKASGYAYRRLFSPEYALLQPQHRIFTKMPAVLADFIMAIAIFLICRKLYDKRKALVGLCIAGLHPAIIHNSAYWGQTDAIYTAFLLLAVLALLQESLFWCGLSLGLAILTKYQVLIALPFLAFFLFRRKAHVLPFLGGILLSLLLIYPFLVHKEALLGVWSNYWDAAIDGSHVSVNALNFWWSVLDGHVRGSSDTVFFLSLTYRQFGAAFFGIAYLFLAFLCGHKIIAATKKETKAVLLMAGIAMCYYAFFLFNTQMHERYMYPFILFAIPFALQHWKYFLLYCLVSVAYYLNQTYPLPFLGIDSWFFSLSPKAPSLVATSLVVLFLVQSAALAQFRESRE